MHSCRNLLLRKSLIDRKLNELATIIIAIASQKHKTKIFFAKLLIFVDTK
jgi:hypothetical protein